MNAKNELLKIVAETKQNIKCASISQNISNGFPSFVTGGAIGFFVAALVLLND